MPPKLDYPELTIARRSWRYTPDGGCLANKVILVTGAGDGIGRAAAKTFAVFGAHVVLLGKTRSKLEAVFERFYSERPRSEKFGTHSGLGLSISRQIIEAHDGTVHAENRIDPMSRKVKGARFVVRLSARPREKS